MAPLPLLSSAFLFSLLFLAVSGSYPRSSQTRTDSAPPEFDPTPMDVYVQPGETAMLPCRVRHLADKDVSWMRGKDFMVISYGRSVFTRDPRFHVISPLDDPASWNLQLRNARLTDSGVYECQVNTDPKIQQRILLTVSDFNMFLDKPEVMEMSMKDDSNIYGPETAILGQETLYPSLGSSLKLTCHIKLRTASGNGSLRQRPERLVDWLHNNVSLLATVGTTVLVDTEKNNEDISSILTVKSLRDEDSGTYTCRPLVSNSSASVLVLVGQGERSEAIQASSGRREPRLVLILSSVLLLLVQFIAPGSPRLQGIHNFAKSYQR